MWGAIAAAGRSLASGKPRRRRGPKRGKPSRQLTTSEAAIRRHQQRRRKRATFISRTSKPSRTINTGSRRRSVGKRGALGRIARAVRRR